MVDFASICEPLAIVFPAAVEYQPGVTGPADQDTVDGDEIVIRAEITDFGISTGWQGATYKAFRALHHPVDRDAKFHVDVRQQRYA